MDNQIQFSVIIPVFNRAHVISSAINSVLCQTFTRYEIIIVDDGSTDDIKTTLEHYQESRLVYLRQENGGGGRARNTGIDNANGDYVAFLDSDDTFLPHHLQTMFDIVRQAPNIVAYSQVIVDRGNGKKALKPPREIQEQENMAEYLCCSRGFVQTSTIVLPTELAKRVRFRDGMKFGQDTDFAIRLSFEPCKFKMAPSPGAIWNDTFDPSRVSSLRKGATNIAWIEEMRSKIPSRAYYGYRGWHIAKAIAKGNKIAAFNLYLQALTRGCYNYRLSFVIFMQIFLADWFYRVIADAVITVKSRVSPQL